MQRTQREAEFLFRTDDVGETRKVTHLKKSALAGGGVGNWEHVFPDEHRLCSIVG